MTSDLFEGLGALFKLRPTGGISQHMQCGADHQVMQDIAGIQVPCMDSPTCKERERERVLGAHFKLRQQLLIAHAAMWADMQETV
jgi:hypothetical protein